MIMDNQSDFQAFGWTRDYLAEVLTGGKQPILTNANLINAFQIVDRADFLPTPQKAYAYEDRGLEFALGQELDSPLTIAQMLQALDPQSGGRYLDIGTGSGYVAALLAAAVGPGGAVYSLERNQQVSGYARQCLAKYGFQNLELLFSDGYQGLTSHAPYKGIHIGFATPEIPMQLAVQLEISGTMVLPLTNMEIVKLTRIDKMSVDEQLIAVKKFSVYMPGVE